MLVETGWDRHFGTAAYLTGDHPFLTRAAAELLRDAGAALVGIDGLNIDSMATPSGRSTPSCSVPGIPIAEHLTNLAALPEQGARLYAVPPRVRGMGTFPVRAFAELPT